MDSILCPQLFSYFECLSGCPVPVDSTLSLPPSSEICACPPSAPYYAACGSSQEPSFFLTLAALHLVQWLCTAVPFHLSSQDTGLPLPSALQICCLLVCIWIVWALFPYLNSSGSSICESKLIPASPGVLWPCSGFSDSGLTWRAFTSELEKVLILHKWRFRHPHKLFLGHIN